MSVKNITSHLQDRDIYDYLLRAGYEDSYYNKEKVEINVLKEIHFQQSKDEHLL